MQWDSSLECGIPVIDYEHQELVGQVAGLMNGPSPEQVHETLNFLGEYVVRHFAHEQLMHRRSNYPKAAEHKAVHEAFVSRFLELDAEYESQGCSQEVLDKIIQVASDWLRDHIMGQDKEFAVFYKKMRLAGSPHNPHM